jgi:hypothetical protein
MSGTSRSTNRRRASSMSAAPSVMRAASPSSRSCRRSVSATARAAIAACRSCAPQTAMAEPTNTVTSGGTVVTVSFHSGLSSASAIATPPTIATSRAVARMATASTGSR